MLGIPVIVAKSVVERVRIGPASPLGAVAPLLLLQRRASRGDYGCSHDAAEYHLGSDRESLSVLKFLLLSAEGLLGADLFFVPHHVHAVSR